MEYVVISGLLAFLVTLVVLPAIIVIAKAKKLYDEPDDKRKVHKRPIPSLGGLAMYIGLMISMLLTLNIARYAPEFQYYIAAFFIMFFLGIKDDIMIISASKKFIGQLIVVLILVFKANLMITNMHGLLGIYQLPAIVSCGLTIFACIVIINAFNLIDGVDGLAGSLGLISSTVFGVFFFINNNFPYAILAFSFSGALVAFLIYNFHPAKIFMGDTGSLLLGLVNSILVIKFIEVGGTSVSYPVTAAPIVGFGILLLPLMDTLRVFSIRIINGKSPFSPDRNHVHHLLLNKGFSHKKVTYTAIAISLATTAISLLLQKTGMLVLLGGQVLFFYAFIYILKYQKPTYGLRVVKGDARQEPTEKVRVLPVFKHEVEAAVADDDRL